MARATRGCARPRGNDRFGDGCHVYLSSLGDFNVVDPMQAPTPGSVADSWRRIEAWLAVNNPALRAALKPPAGDAELAEVENAIGANLPGEFKESWRAHDGNGDTPGSLIPARDAPGDRYGNATTPGGYYLMPCSEVLQEWRSWKRLADSGEFAGQESTGDPRIQRAWWHPGWAPFASNGGGDSICLDLAPTPRGTVGQVITMDHETSEREVLAPSYARWLAEVADLVEHGKGTGG
jgi:cell wall assembly regulator SMI1